MSARSDLIRFVRALGLSIVAGAALVASTGAWAYEHESTLEDAHYLLGYQAYLERNYALCADHFYQSDASDVRLSRRARLLLAFCQARIGIKQLAAYNLHWLTHEDFRGADLKVYKAVSGELDAELKSLAALRSWAFPYLGYGSYSAVSEKSSASVLGAAGGFGNLDWGLSFAAERLAITLKDGSGYQQTQFALVGSRALGTSWGIRGNFTYIGSNNSSYSGIAILGAGATVTPWSTATIGLDYQHSRYPNLSLGLMNVNQFSGSLDQRLWSDATSVLHSQLTVQSVLARAPVTTDSDSGFTLKPSYLRWVLDVEYRMSEWVLSIQGWTGSEAFGARNQAQVVYNVMEEHQYGWSGKVFYQAFKETAFQASYGKEGFTTSGGKASLGVFSLGLLLNL